MKTSKRHPTVGTSAIVWGLWGVMAVGSMAMAYAIVKIWRIGPVVAVVSARRGWGVHVGDALALPFLVAAGVAATKVMGPRRALGRRASR